MGFPQGVNVWYLNLYGDRTQLNQYYSILKLLFLSVLVFYCSLPARDVLTGLQLWLKPVYRLSDLLFGPMLAVVFRRHPIFPSKLAIEIGEVGKATVVRNLRDSLVGLS